MKTQENLGPAKEPRGKKARKIKEPHGKPQGNRKEAWKPEENLKKMKPKRT